MRWWALCCLGGALLGVAVIAVAAQPVAAPTVQRGIVNPSLYSLQHLPRAPDPAVVAAKVAALLRASVERPWPALEPGGLLMLGHDHPLLPAIRQRLVLLGDLPSSAVQGSTFDLAFYRGVIRFQHRHGLKPDGIIGPNTLAWLNTGPARRAALLLENYRRQAVFFRQAPSDYLLVNIPQFQLSLVADGRALMQSRVIVGRRWRPTPEISSEIKNLVVNPGWNVPPRIARRELWPKIQRDAGYLTRHQYDVTDLAGEAIHLDEIRRQPPTDEPFPYRLRQRPGPHNTLGRYKLYFTNPFNVYLHDTPDKQLFRGYQRTYSAGCVRVERAEALASHIAERWLADQRRWRLARQSRTDNQWLALKQPLGIHLVYWTAWLDERQLLHFRRDIYQRYADGQQALLSGSGAIGGVSPAVSTNK